MILWWRFYRRSIITRRLCRNTLMISHALETMWQLSQYNRNVVFTGICIMHCLPFSRIMVFTGIYIIQCMPFFPDEQSDYTIQESSQIISSYNFACHFFGRQSTHISDNTTIIYTRGQAERVKTAYMEYGTTKYLIYKKSYFRVKI